VTSALAPGYSGKSLGWIDGSRVAARDKRLIGIRTGVEVTDPHAIGARLARSAASTATVSP